MHLNGICGCENVKFYLSVSFPVDSFSPRTCDCDFCVKNRISYISDTQGHAQVNIKNPSLIKLVKQGHELAHFLMCQGCNAVVCAIYTEDQKKFLAFNTDLILTKDQFAASLLVSPKKLTESEKTTRWKQLWFPQVEFYSDVQDFYYEGQFVVFTEMYHLKRGYCCNSGCRRCPYKEKN